MLRLNNSYYLKFDPYNYQLWHNYISTAKETKGKEVSKWIGYYGSITSVIKAVADHKAKLSLANRTELNGISKEMYDYIDETVAYLELEVRKIAVQNKYNEGEENEREISRPNTN